MNADDQTLANGCWIAHSSGGNLRAVFPTEIEALRYALANYMTVDFVPWGEEIVAMSPDDPRHDPPGDPMTDHATEQVAPKVLSPDDLGMHLLASGVRVTEIGEDGDVMLLGHHDARSALGMFAEFSLYRDGYEMTNDDLSVYDVRRSHASFSDHSESCERENCECEQDDCCVECRYLNHDECDGQDCLCADDWDHDRPKEWPCSCECYCDEYAWWAIETKTGHDVTWVTYSWAKAKAKAQTIPSSMEHE